MPDQGPDVACSLQFELLAFPEANLKAAWSVPLWILMLSILAGLLLLALVCLLLWKVRWRLVLRSQVKILRSQEASTSVSISFSCCVQESPLVSHDTHHTVQTAMGVVSCDIISIITVTTLSPAAFLSFSISTVWLL